MLVGRRPEATSFHRLTSEWGLAVMALPWWRLSENWALGSKRPLRVARIQPYVAQRANHQGILMFSERSMAHSAISGNPIRAVGSFPSMASSNEIPRLSALALPAQSRAASLSR